MSGQAIVYVSRDEKTGVITISSHAKHADPNIRNTVELSAPQARELIILLEKATAS